MITLGSAATGTIAPAADTYPSDSFFERIQSGEFLRNVDDTVACGCIDGRTGAQLHPSSAGGTISLMVLRDILQTRHNAPTVELLNETIEHLQKQQYPIGGHIDDHAVDPATGCGANDKLATIYATVRENQDAIRSLAQRLGVKISDDEHSTIVAGFDRREEFSMSVELRDALSAASSQAIDTVVGSHNEVCIVVNTKPGTTLDHEALAAEFGNDQQAFCVDAWSFETSATAVFDDIEPTLAVAALVYFNLATALTLCGPDMPVITI